MYKSPAYVGRLPRGAALDPALGIPSLSFTAVQGGSGMLGHARHTPGRDQAGRPLARGSSRPLLRVHTEDVSAEVAARVDTLLRRIQDRTAVVGMVGLGYVGLPFAVEKAKVGYRVIGIDQNPDRARRINAGENYVPDVNSEELSALVRVGRLEAMTDFSRVPEMDVVVIAVPTPLTRNRTPDLRH